MKQNKYDDPAFFQKYSEMPRSIGGLAEAGEWPAFCQILPELHDKQVLDLGCGFGWHCRYARDQKAKSVIGIDLSEKMLARAKAATSDAGITYFRMAIEDIDFAENQFDLVISSLAFHYVRDFKAVCRKVHRCMQPGGTFAFSVEHPILTCVAEQAWCKAPNGKRLHWPVDTYQQEGPRNTKWLDGEVIKYHRTVASYVNTLLETGFQIKKLLEPEPLPEHLKKHPDWIDEKRRPLFLLIAADRI